jgi:hypothetical protein
MLPLVTKRKVFMTLQPGRAVIVGVEVIGFGVENVAG